MSHIIWRIEMYRHELINSGYSCPAATFYIRLKHQHGRLSRLCWLRSFNVRHLRSKTANSKNSWHDFIRFIDAQFCRNPTGDDTWMIDTWDWLDLFQNRTSRSISPSPSTNSDNSSSSRNSEKAEKKKPPPPKRLQSRLVSTTSDSSKSRHASSTSLPPMSPPLSSIMNSPPSSTKPEKGLSREDSSVNLNTFKTPKGTV